MLPTFGPETHTLVSIGPVSENGRSAPEREASGCPYKKELSRMLVASGTVVVQRSRVSWSRSKMAWRTFWEFSYIRGAPLLTLPRMTRTRIAWPL